MQNGQEIRRRAKKMGAREDDDDDDDVGYPGFDCRSRRNTTAPANPTRGGKYTLTPGPTEDNGARRMASRPISFRRFTYGNLVTTFTSSK